MPLEFPLDLPTSPSSCLNQTVPYPSPLLPRPCVSQTVSAMKGRIIVALVSCAIWPSNVRAQNPGAVVSDTTAAGASLVDASPYPLLVDLGYGIYNGVHNSTTGLNVWKGLALPQ